MIWKYKISSKIENVEEKEMILEETKILKNKKKKKNLEKVPYDTISDNID